jgi:hypothetical protein
MRRKRPFVEPVSNWVDSPQSGDCLRAGRRPINRRVRHRQQVAGRGVKLVFYGHIT